MSVPTTSASGEEDPASGHDGLIHVTCPSCSADHGVPVAMAGRVGRCPCGASIRIPDPTPQAKPAFAAPVQLRSWMTHPALLTVVVATCLALTAWLVHDPLLDEHPFVIATPSQAPAQTHNAALTHRPMIWRLETPDGVRHHLLASWHYGRLTDAQGGIPHIALADASKLAWYGDEAAGARRVSEVVRGSGLRRLRIALREASIAWELGPVTTSQLHDTIQDSLSVRLGLERRNALAQRLVDLARNMGKDVAILDPDADSGGDLLRCQASFAMLQSRPEAAATLAELHTAFIAGNLDTFDLPPAARWVEPMAPDERAARMARLSAGISAACGAGRPVLVVVDALDLPGSDGLLRRLATDGLGATALADDPFSEFPHAYQQILEQAGNISLRPELVAAWIRREPRLVRQPGVIEALATLLSHADLQPAITQALAAACPPFSPRDANLVERLRLWHTPGSGAAIAGLPADRRSTVAQIVLEGGAEQDWPSVVGALGRLEAPQLVACAMSVGHPSAYAALRARIIAEGAMADPRCVAILLQQDARPGSPAAMRRDELLALARAHGVPGADADVDGPWLQRAVVEHWRNRPGDPIDTKLWAKVGAERWRRWWLDGSVDRSLLAAAAAAGARNRDPASALGGLAVAGLEAGDSARDRVMAELGEIRYQWLFLLRMWASSRRATERTATETMLAQLDPDWAGLIATAYADRGMISDEHTRPLAQLVAAHPRCLARLLAHRPSPTAATGAVIAGREVMMARELGSCVIPAAEAILADPTADRTARDNATILLGVMRMTPAR